MTKQNQYRAGEYGNPPKISAVIYIEQNVYAAMKRISTKIYRDRRTFFSPYLKSPTVSPYPSTLVAFDSINSALATLPSWILPVTSGFLLFTDLDAASAMPNVFGVKALL